MAVFDFKQIFDGSTWYVNQRITIDATGSIQSIDASPSPEKCRDYLIPSFINSHSHAFQYAMAGLAEKRPPHETDDFWSWRHLMYEISHTISDDNFYTIAELLFSLMVRSGYHTVVEFHYLHRTDLQESLYRSEILAEASRKAGIRLMLVPVYYGQGDFGKAVSDHQKVFSFSTVDRYLKALEDLRPRIENSEVKVGSGVHSLRAASQESIKTIVSASPQNLPFHIHIAEQQKEVTSCLQFYNKRPVEWLLSEFPSIPHLNLVHATHLIEQEVKAIAAYGATVVLCPSTEANLGDGIFPMHEYAQYDGTWALGSDSQIQLNPFEELRLIEYAQRLTRQRRNILCDQQGENGRYLFKKALQGGELSVAHLFRSQIQVGFELTGMIIDENHPNLAGKSDDDLLSALIFCCDTSTIKDHIIAGESCYSSEKTQRFAHVLETYQAMTFSNMRKR